MSILFSEGSIKYETKQDEILLFETIRKVEPGYKSKNTASSNFQKVLNDHNIAHISGEWY